MVRRAGMKCCYETFMVLGMNPKFGYPLLPAFTCYVSTTWIYTEIHGPQKIIPLGLMTFSNHKVHICGFEMGFLEIIHTSVIPSRLTVIT